MGAGHDVQRRARVVGRHEGQVVRLGQDACGSALEREIVDAPDDRRRGGQDGHEGGQVGEVREDGEQDDEGPEGAVDAPG